MSTKNIARTALEGGRVKSNKNERRLSNRYERKDTRRLMRRIIKDLEFADDCVMPERQPLRKDSICKMSAPTRWFVKRAMGLTAEEIRGMLLRSFDTRSHCCRHLVYQHLMPRQFGNSPELHVPIKGRPELGFDEDDVFGECIFWLWAGRNFRKRRWQSSRCCRS
jgi:hypothetical protein